MSAVHWREEPIAKAHDRSGFDCGRVELDEFLRRYARQSHDSGVSKIYVAVDPAAGTTILGFYTLSPAQVDFHRVPDAARPRARYDIGGFRLGRLAVSKRLQGRGFGGQLLLSAGRRCLRASVEMGGTTLMIDAKDEPTAAWYRLYGAVSLLDMPLSLVLPYAVLRDALSAAGKPIDPA